MAAGRALFALYFIPILATAWFFGVGPTVLATVSALLVPAWFVYVEPAWSFALPGRRQPVLPGGLPAGGGDGLAGPGAAATRRAALAALAVAARAQRAAAATVWDWARLAPSVHPEDRPRVKEALARALQSGRSIQLELRVKDPAEAIACSSPPATSCATMRAAASRG